MSEQLLRVRACDYQVAPDDVREKYHRGDYWLVAVGALTEPDATGLIVILAAHCHSAASPAIVRLKLDSGFAVLLLLPRSHWSPERVVRTLGLDDPDGTVAGGLARRTAVLMLPPELDYERFLAEIETYIPKPE